ncbi:hypothetical protein F8M41_023609 [Gigaspora margarita]|uniref:Apple domain-containing protein n=1 Tax=Gigaspora margarita TaxID=4874 RepID=A0A8H4AD17_GIGMA|nr:hypothetical protein F8M41_023609 [Gigaspora margarita]
MKYRTLNLFLIVLLSSLLVLTIVDANNHKLKAAKINSHNDEHKICTFTQTSSHTVTIYETPAYKAYETPSYKTRGSRHYNNDQRDKHNSEAYRNHAYEKHSYETRDNHISRHYNNGRYYNYGRHYVNGRKDKHNSDCKKTITVTFTPTTTLCSTPTPTPTCCQSSGGPGWQNEFHHISSANIFIINNITSPQDCCKSCLDDPECLQWALPGQCLNYKNQPGLTDICTTTTVNNTGFGSGIIRCNDSGNCI